jgi:hypothetical protein
MIIGAIRLTISFFVLNIPIKSKSTQGKSSKYEKDAFKKGGLSENKIHLLVPGTFKKVDY